MASATRAGHRWLKWVGFLIVLCALAFAAFWYARNGNGNEPALNTVAVSRGDIQNLVSATGVLEPSNYVDVGAQVSGQLELIHVRVGQPVSTGDLLAEIAEAAFSTDAGKVTAPLPGPGGIGFYLVKVREVQPAHPAKLEDVKEKLRADIARERSIDALYTQVNRMEDDLGKGMTIEATAEDMGIKPIKIDAVDAQGLGPDGKPAAGLPENAQQIVASAFETEEGTDST